MMKKTSFLSGLRGLPFDGFSQRFYILTHTPHSITADGSQGENETD